MDETHTITMPSTVEERRHTPKVTPLATCHEACCDCHLSMLAAVSVMLDKRFVSKLEAAQPCVVSLSVAFPFPHF